MELSTLRRIGHVIRRSGNKDCILNFGRKPLAIWPLGRQRGIWDDNIKMELKYVVSVGVGWISLRITSNQLCWKFGSYYQRYLIKKAALLLSFSLITSLEQSPSWEGSPTSQEMPRLLMYLWSSSLCSQESVTCLYSELAKTSPHSLSPHFVNILFNSILPSTPKSSKQSLHFETDISLFNKFLAYSSFPCKLRYYTGIFLRKR
jgi:hypothetical protein